MQVIDCAGCCQFGSTSTAPNFGKAGGTSPEPTVDRKHRRGFSCWPCILGR